MFVQAQQQRYKSVTDENGNPTFTTLHEDIGNIGNDILESTAKNIIDPEVANDFRQRFGSYVANQKISALKKAQGMQLQYSRSSLDTGLGKLIQQAAGDDIDQLGSYEQQGLDSLQQALAGGVISEDEFKVRSQEFSTVVREAAISNTIATDRAKAAQVLQHGPEKLGISEEKHIQLVEDLTAAVASDEVEALKAQELNKIDTLTQESTLVDETLGRIEADAIREDELLKMRGQISDTKFSQLKKKYIAQAEKRAKERAEFEDIGSKIVNGEDISAIKPSKINGFYDHMVKQRSDLTGQPVSLTEEARLATAIPAPVTHFATKLEHAAKYGTEDNAEEALAAYSYIKARNKPTLDSQFDKDATMVMEQTEFLVERAGLNPRDAMLQARDRIFNSDDAVQETNLKSFKKLDEFKDANIEEFAADTLDTESFFGANRISRDSVNTFRELAREYYRKTPDIQQAASYAKQQMNKTHGFSEISGDSEYMFAPPEKKFPNVPPETLRHVLVTEMSPLLPTGVEPSKVRVVSDDSTADAIFVEGLQGGEKTRFEVPTWLVEYEVEDADGNIITVPLTNPKTGLPVRWTPAGSQVLAEEQSRRQQEEIQKAEEARKQFLSDEARGVNDPRIIQDIIRGGL